MSLEVINLDSVDQPYRRQEESIGSNASRKPPGRMKRLATCLFSRLCVGLIIAGIVGIVVLCVAFLVSYEKDTEVTLTFDVFKEELSAEQATWYESNLDELKYALNVPTNGRRAKNVILFVADGFPPDIITSARSHRYGTDNGFLSWERFPHMGLLKHENKHSAATAIFGGVRGYAGTAGVDLAIRSDHGDCNVSEIHRVTSILQLAHGAGMATGFVSNTDPRDATAAALYAHVANNSWACASAISTDDESNRGCSDIETQLLTADAARSINLIIGKQEAQDLAGGRCTRLDEIVGSNFRLVQVEDLNSFPKQANRIRALVDKGSMKEVAVSAVGMMEKMNKGFLLVVLCKRMKSSLPTDTMEQVLELDDAVRNVMNLLKNSLDDTLLISTSTPFVTDENSNDVVDTAIHAKGPMAHLFHKVHDQSYAAHVIAFAARLGRFRDSMLASSLFEWF